MTAELAVHPVQELIRVMSEAMVETPVARSGRFTPRELGLALFSAMHGQIALWHTAPLPEEFTGHAMDRKRLVFALVGGC